MEQPLAEQKLSKVLYILTGLGIASGLILTLLSWSGICSTACAEGHSYRLFDMPFEWTGLLFFGLLLFAFILSKKSFIACWMTGLLLAAGLGAEVMFILIQKYTIGSWCPICLSIAASLITAAVAWGIGSLARLKWLIEKGQRKDIMYSLKKALTICSTVFLGFIVTFFGVTKKDDLLAAESTFQERITFSKENAKNDQVQIYVFTSWICPACQRFEPYLERIFPDIAKKANVIFVDYGVDDTTLNYLPYHLSFMFYNKDRYIELRRMLKEMGKTKEEPTDSEVEQAALELGVHYQQLHYADVAAGIEYYKDLATNMKVQYLPTFVILNPENKKIIELSGSDDITLTNVLQAIDKVGDKKSTD